MKITDLFILPTTALLFMIASIEGCHVPTPKRQLNQKQQIADYISTCLANKAGYHRYRWKAIADFAVKDTSWYDEAGKKFCRDIDTSDCWKKQIDVLIRESSPYSGIIKICVRDYEISTAPHTGVSSEFYDDSHELQGARTGRAKRSSNLSNFIWHLVTGRQWSEPGESSLSQNATNHPPLQSSNSESLRSGDPQSTAVYPLTSLTQYSVLPTTPKPASAANQFHAMHAPYPNWLLSTLPPATVSTQHSDLFSFTTTQSAYGQSSNSYNHGQNHDSFTVPNDAYQTFPAWWPKHAAHSQYVTEAPLTTLPPLPYSSTYSIKNQPEPGINHPLYTTSQPHAQWTRSHPPHQGATTMTPGQLYEDNSQLSDNDKTLLQLLQMIDKPPTTTPSPNLSMEDFLKLLKSKPNSFITGTLCDQSKTRFSDCVKAKLGSEESRMLRLFGGTFYSQDDVDSILNFFDENHSKCRSYISTDPRTGAVTRQCLSQTARSGATTCLPTFMQRLAKSGTNMGDILLLCTQS